MASLFRYQTTLIGDKRSAPILIKGSRKWIETFIPLVEFAEIFGGYVLWRPPSKRSALMPGEGLGVWGKRNVAKLQRILRERGAEFEVVLDEGPVQQWLFERLGAITPTTNPTTISAWSELAGE